MVKDLGAVTAYGYAKEHGYAGTEEEFAALMASYASVAQTAVAAAESAEADALKSEGFAVGQQNGTEVGSGSPYYHNNAEYFKEQASSSATTASNKAGEAAQSATDASNAKIAAQTAQGKAEDAQIAAETAQGKAEDAQEAAEAVAQSIPADYSELSADVGNLKSDFYHASNLILDNLSNQNKWGVYNSTGVFSSNVVTLTATTASAEVNIRYVDKITKFVSGHKYYASCKMKASVLFRGRIYVGNTYTDRLRCEKGEWNIVDGIVSPTSNSELGFYAQGFNGGAIGDEYQISDPFLIDITEAFDSDEPTVETMRKILKGETSTAFTLKQYQNILGAKSAGMVIVAGANSAFVGLADYTATGANDQILINSIIANQNVTGIYLTPDSTFSIAAPINLKSDFRLLSDGAKIVMENQASETITSKASSGATNLYRTSDECVDKFAAGMFIEITDGTNSESHYISSISYPNGKITLDSAISHTFASGSTIKNVSSAISGDTITDTIVEGLIIDLNLTNNPQATNTFYAQNGIHLISSSRCRIRNCDILNGGRHGVLFYEVNDSFIEGCYINNWSEHCVDLYESGTGLSVDGTIRNNTVSNCILSNATLAGVQNHGGSGNTIIGCVFRDNGECGVSCYGGANNNLITDCRFTGNDIGIKVQTNAKNVSITNCQISGNTKDGIDVFTSVDGLTITGNQIHDNGRDGIGLSSTTTNTLIRGNNISKNTQYQIFFDNASDNVVEGNIIIGSSNARCIYAYHTCERNSICRNVFTKNNSTYAIKLDSGSNYTVAVGNIFKNFSSPVSDSGSNSIVEDNYSL